MCPVGESSWKLNDIVYGTGDAKRKMSDCLKTIGFIMDKVNFDKSKKFHMMFYPYCFVSWYLSFYSHRVPTQITQSIFMMIPDFSSTNSEISPTKRKKARYKNGSKSVDVTLNLKHK